MFCILISLGRLPFKGKNKTSSAGSNLDRAIDTLSDEGRVLYQIKKTSTSKRTSVRKQKKAKSRNRRKAQNWRCEISQKCPSGIAVSAKTAILKAAVEEKIDQARRKKLKRQAFRCRNNGTARWNTESSGPVGAPKDRFRV